MLIQVLLWIAAFAFSLPPLIRTLIHLMDGKPGNIFKPLAGTIVAVTAAAVLSTSVGQVPAGHRGVVLRFGAVTGEAKGEGLYFVTPFVNSIVLMDVQVHAFKAKATAASRDLQDVNTELTLNARLDPGKVAETYRSLRQDYADRIIAPSVQEAVKATTARYDAEELITKRPLVRSNVEDMLRERLAIHGIILDQLSITDFAFSPDFTTAIEAKVIASQNALKAENDLRRIKVEAEQRISQAQGEAEAIRIQAESIAKQGGAEYVHLKAIEKWDGSLPTLMSGNTVPFINLNLPDKSKN